MKTLYCMVVMLAGMTVSALAAERPVVLELFTSQGCSSCPPADALLKQLSTDPSLLALSFHVDYWNNLGWKDPFASAANTARQHMYATIFKSNSIYTPQMVVDGVEGMVGSDEETVQNAIANAKTHMTVVPVSITPAAKGDLAIHVEGGTGQPAKILGVFFMRGAVTQVKAGENEGRTLESTNNVTRIVSLGEWKPKGNQYAISAQDFSEDGVAVLVQDISGQITGAASYVKP